MARIEERIDIAAPSSTVFNFCHDIEKRPEWDERVVRTELLTNKPIRQGTLIQVDEGRAGRFLYSWEGEYSSFHFPSNYTIQVLDAAASSPFSAGSESWQFSAMGGSTRVALTWEYKPRGLLARVVDSLVRRALTRRAIRRSLANLKEMIESG